MKLEPAETIIDIYAESRFCIAEKHKNKDEVRKRSKLSKMNISDSLELVQR